LLLNSDNTFYEPYTVKASEVLEVWEYVCNIGRSDRKTEFTTDHVTSLLMEMRSELRAVKAKMNNA
jgi:hypothetical protein